MRGDHSGPTAQGDYLFTGICYLLAYESVSLSHTGETDVLERSEESGGEDSLDFFYMVEEMIWSIGYFIFDLKSSFNTI